METISERNLASILGAKFGSVTATSGGNGTEFIIDCPFCSHHKLSVNAKKGVWQCWHCHETGTVRRLLGRSVKVEPRPVVEKPKERGYTPPGTLVPLDLLPEDHEACLYLATRKFDPKELSRNFGLSYCNHGREFAGGVFNTSGTIVIPVVENGVQTAWQSRLLYDPDKVPENDKPAYGFKYDADRGKYIVPPKYFTMPGFRKGEHFFNFDQASKFDFVVVTEGAFDAMRVGRCAVAGFGKGLSETQIEILRSCWKVVILLLDPDAESDQEKLRIRLEGSGPFGRTSSTGVKVVSMHLTGYKDAGETPKRELSRQIVLASMAEGVDLREFAKENPFK